MNRVDPSEFARRKAEAMVRAKELKFNRAHATDENLTFKPKLVSRPTGYVDSLDMQTAKHRVGVIKAQIDSGDLFERPLPATLQKTITAPSPGSDALGKMMKAQGSVKGAPSSPPKLRAPAVAPPSAVYIPAPVEPLGLNSRKDRLSTAEVQAQFQRSLRPEVSSSELDTAAAHQVARRRPSVPTPAAFAPTTRERERLATPTKPPLAAASATTTPPTKSRQSPTKASAAAALAPFASPRTQGLVKSRLSLLKSKIVRKSESSVVVNSRAPTGLLSRSSTAPYSPETSPLRSARSSAGPPRTAPGNPGSTSRNTSAGSQSRSSASNAGAFFDDLIRSNAPAGLGLGMSEGEADDAPQQQQQCEQCGRLFNPGPYARHVKICAKVFSEKRKVFDAKEQRIGDNPELVALDRKKNEPRGRRAGGGAGANGANGAKEEAATAEAAAKKKKLWKEQSGAFRQAMRAAREVSQAIAGGGPMPEFKPSAPDPSMLECPTCGRRFNQKAGERHIPQCKDIKAKPSRLSKGSGLGGGVQGTLQAATGYAALSKPPPPVGAGKRPTGKR